jgi:hypothetical protein
MACREVHRAVGVVNAWWIDSIPSVDISGTDSAGLPLLIDPVGATVLSDGQIVVADRWGTPLRYFDSTGRPIRAVGRSGPGPGEFSIPVWLGQCGPDTVVVWDRQYRATVLDGAGRVIRQLPIPSDPAMGSPPRFLACSRTGRFAYLGAPRDFQIGEPAMIPLFLADRAGNVTDAPGDVPAWDGRTQGRLTRIALSDEFLYVGTAESSAVDIYTHDGIRRGVVQWAQPRRRATERHYRRAIDQLVMQLAAPDDRDRARRVVRERQPVAEYLPPYTELLTDPAGTLWVVLSAPGDSVSRIRAMDREGAALGELRIPVELRVFEVGNDYILGAYEDTTTDEPHVVVFRFRRW